MLFYSHDNGKLADDLRKEIDAVTLTTKAADGTVTKTLDVTSLKENCPLLLSAYQEVLRDRSMGTSVREVMEDTYLDQYLLKKGAMLQMPSRIIHQDPDLWGDDVAEFNPRRFMPGGATKQPKPSCFRGFGGGKTLCPGRHFATNEILAVVATFLVRFDMKPAGGKKWEFPTTLNTAMAATIMEPDTDVEVEVDVRKGFEGVKWVVRLDDSDKTFAIVVEDKE
ncbi:cytochrome P450 protein [Podospora australis]|uniref:Cytochrome P450 protein n=1 Tax=Podospora australis TaxID=1536484 RepID=A0AAN7AEW2_9PEZI|nr:cytochrome P450 protein [Podospora australis]